MASQETVFSFDTNTVCQSRQGTYKYILCQRKRYDVIMKNFVSVWDVPPEIPRQSERPFTPAMADSVEDDVPYSYLTFDYVYIFLAIMFAVMHRARYMSFNLGVFVMFYSLNHSYSSVSSKFGKNASALNPVQASGGSIIYPRNNGCKAKYTSGHLREVHTFIHIQSQLQVI